MVYKVYKGIKKQIIYIKYHNLDHLVVYNNNFKIITYIIYYISYLLYY